jgi:hypothetical protein
MENEFTGADVEDQVKDAEAAVEEVAGSNGVPDKENLLAGVRKLRDERVGEDHKKDLDIPGYDGLLMARFRPYQMSKSERAANSLRERAERGDPVILDVACDTLVHACSEILVRKNKDSDPISIDDEVPVRFDTRLSEVLGLGVPEPPKGKARDVVKALFFTEQGIVAMAMTVDAWLRDVYKEVDEELLGE